MSRVVPDVTGLLPTDSALGDTVASADPLIGTVLLAGAVAPHLISRQQAAQMRPRSASQALSAAMLP